MSGIRGPHSFDTSQRTKNCLKVIQNIMSRYFKKLLSYSTTFEAIFSTYTAKKQNTEPDIILQLLAIQPDIENFGKNASTVSC